MKVVKDLMVPADECGSVQQDMTLGEAIRTLNLPHDWQITHSKNAKYPTLLVLDNDQHAVGKLGHTDIVVSMDPAFRGHQGRESIAYTATAGLSPALLKSLTQRYSLWSGHFEEKCHEVLSLKVKDCMCLPGEENCVLESDFLEVAIHKLAAGYHQTLLVTSEADIVGILRMSDLFDQIIRECQHWNEQDAGA